MLREEIGDKSNSHLVSEKPPSQQSSGLPKINISKSYSFAFLSDQSPIEFTNNELNLSTDTQATRPWQKLERIRRAHTAHHTHSLEPMKKIAELEQKNVGLKMRKEIVKSGDSKLWNRQEIWICLLTCPVLGITGKQIIEASLYCDWRRFKALCFDKAE